MGVCNGNVLQGAAGFSDTILLVFVVPACTGQMRGPALGGMDHPPGKMAVKRYVWQVVYIDPEPGRTRCRSAGVCVRVDC